MRKAVSFLLEYGLLFIITIPAFTSLINPDFFSMHDSQQAARLYVLTEALKQGEIYPRWVDMFGFNFGYPLFNFYPPLIYYVGALFYGLGASVLWSVKLVFISGYVLAAVGIYLFVKLLLKKRVPAYLSAVLYTYFTYHAINAYVRGAMAEFFSITVLPFVFWSLERLRQNITVRNALLFGITFGALIVTHPLIAFPSTLFIGAFIIYSLVLSKKKVQYLSRVTLGGVSGLLLSAFFWLPSMMERKFTLVDDILLTELADYAIHFVQPDQLWFSPWGYGGSGPGYSDGMTFQLGKVHILAAALSLVACLVALVLYKRTRLKLKSPVVFCDYGFFAVATTFSIFMMIEASRFIWDTVSFLHYLQFPWRFMTFTGLFISVAAAYGIYFLLVIVKKKSHKAVAVAAAVVISAAALLTYQKYFTPQNYLNVTDQDLTSFDEIAWRVSRTSFEFIPKGVKTKQSNLNTTIPDLEQENVVSSKYQLSNGAANVSGTHTKYREKKFEINVFTDSVTFRLNTYNFPGWTAYIDGEQASITDNNDFKLISIVVPKGRHSLKFVFENTPVRTIGNILSMTTLLSTAGYFGIVAIRYERSTK